MQDIPKCFYCKKPITPDTAVERITESIIMHPACIGKAADLIFGERTEERRSLDELLP